jgi:hypothetical protein
MKDVQHLPAEAQRGIQCRYCRRAGFGFILIEIHGEYGWVAAE